MLDNDRNLAEQIAKKFIARRDVKAIQFGSGGYRPVTQKISKPDGSTDSVNIPFQMADLVAHVQGRHTFGHYLLDEHNKCKFFAFDIDLNDGDCELATKDHRPPCCQAGHGNWIELPDLNNLDADLTTPDAYSWYLQNSTVHPARPRESWRDRSHPGRSWWKTQMRELGDMLASRIRSGLGIPSLVTYTGSKGLHVYGFTGYADAEVVREGAIHVLESFNRFEPLAGKNFYRDAESDPLLSFAANFSIEVFPKQTKVEPGHYGNLMRLPFGRNLKNPQDPTFIVDHRKPPNVLAPVPDQLLALETLDPYKGQPR